MEHPEPTALGSAMRVLVECGDYRCGNMGDVAMLQVTVARLGELWPGAAIRVMTWDPERLARYCPGVEPVPGRGRDTWLADRTLLGRLHGVLPKAASRALVRSRHAVRRRWPGAIDLALRVRGALPVDVAQDMEAFRSAVDTADLVIVAGAGGITDHAHRWAMPVLEVLEMAVRRGTPAAMMSHGLGPLATDDQLRQRAREVLPRLDLIALREQLLGKPLLADAGVDPQRVRITGDDAIEPAYRARHSALGESVGVNVRLSSSSALDASICDALRPVLHVFAKERGAAPVPLPIDASDVDSIRTLLSGFPGEVNDHGAIDTPAALIERVSRCRIVVTCAYHAAVFAASQGIPVVCLAKSSYFLGKFRGLADQFGEGCSVVALDEDGAIARLRREIDRAWDCAAAMRPSLLDAATRQIAAGRRAYQDVAQLAASRAAARGGVLRRAGATPAASAGRS